MISPAKVKTFLSKHHATVLSLSSIFIAACSLVFTIMAERIDLFYRETLIRPLFAWHVDLQNFSVKLVNNGLGPGLVKRVMWRMKDRCFVSNPDDPVGWTSSREQFEDFMNAYFLDEVIADVKVRQIIGTRPATFTAVPTPDQMLAAGKEIVVFGVTPDSEAALRAGLAKLPDEMNAEVRRRFAHQATMFPMVVQYCSATERFCTVTPAMGDIGRCR